MYSRKQESIDLLLHSTKRFVDSKISPKASQWEKGQKGVPPTILDELGRLGFFGLLIGSEFGGSNLDIASYARVTEVLAMGDCGITNLINVNNSPVAVSIETYGSNTQKQEYLNNLANGTTRGCFMLSEPNAGSDAASIETTAKKVSGGYLLEGNKKFVTGGASAGLGLVAAKTEKSLGKKGITLFLVPRESYKVARLEDKMGHRNIDTANVLFENSFVPENAVLGEPGVGYKICLEMLATGRIAVAAQGIGVAMAAFKKAREYALDRKTFGKAIIKHQSVSFRLADMATKISSARQLTLFAASLVDQGKNAIAESSMAKIHAAAIAEQVTSDALQIFGGDGYIKETGIEKLFRDARVLSIYEGTNDIQKIVIGREIERGWSPDGEI